MPVSKVKKQMVITDFSKHPKDTGSAEVQIALLTERISSLTDHFKKHKKDNNSRRGLLALIGRRRRLLKYLKENDLTSYDKILGQLNLRK